MLFLIIDNIFLKNVKIQFRIYYIEDDKLKEKQI